ncbi:MAG: DegV family protein [Candidatus Tyrphobacter sp.]
MAVAIVTDSTSDIEPQRAQGAGITIVPLFVTFGDLRYRDLVDLSRAAFYERLVMDSALPGTSQPTAAMFEDAFAAAPSDTVLCITISSHLSGTINSARAAAQRTASKRVEIFDSQSASGGLGLMVLRAAEMASQGASVESILEALERERRTAAVFACIPDLSHLQRTGRIGRARAALGTLMRIVPVLAVEEGQVVAKAQVRTFSRALDTMLDLCMESIGDPAQARIVIMHTNAPELAAANRSALLSRLGTAPRTLEVWEAGPVIATHGGPGAVGICTG